MVTLCNIHLCKKYLYSHLNFFLALRGVLTKKSQLSSPLNTLLDALFEATPTLCSGVSMRSREVGGVEERFLIRPCLFPVSMRSGEGKDEDDVEKQFLLMQAEVRRKD